MRPEPRGRATLAMIAAAVLLVCLGTAVPAAMADADACLAPAAASVCPASATPDAPPALGPSGLAADRGPEPSTWAAAAPAPAWPIAPPTGPPPSRSPPVAA